MPLIKSGSKDAISKNIETEMTVGKKPKNQAIAIAMDIARRAERALGGRMGYAGGGEVSDAKMSRAISDRAMRGLEPTPEQKQYLANMQAMRDKRGEENLSAITSLGQRDIPMPDASMARKVSNRAMSGREDFTPQEQQHIESSLPGKEERSEGLGNVGALGAEITGIPGMMRGADNLTRPDADMLTRAAGIGEMGLSMLPYSGVVREALPLVAAATKTAPRVVGTSLALSAPGAINDARAAETSAQSKLSTVQAPAYMTKELDALRTERDALMKQYNAMNDQHRRSGPETQRKALAPFETQISLLNNKINEAEGRIRDHMKQATEAARADLPFRERHPGAAEAISGGAVALGTALPFAANVKNRLGNKLEEALMGRAATKAANTFDSDPVKFAEMQRGLSRRADRLDAATGLPHNLWDYGKSAALSSLMQFEAAAAPELVDALSFSPNHPTRDAALAQLSNQDYYKARVLPAIMWGMGTAGLGKEAAHLMTPSAKVPESARAIIERGSDKSISDLQKIERFRQAAEAAKGSGQQRSASRQLEGAATEILPPVPPETPGPRGQSTGSLPSLSTGEPQGPIPALRRSPNVEDVPSQPTLPSPYENFKPSERIVPTGNPNAKLDELESLISGLSYKDLKPGASGRTNHGERGKFDSPKAQFERIKKDLLDKVQTHKEADGFNRGGIVGRAMQIAKNAGGAVLTGPVTHRADGGRTDTVETHLPANSYVVPADVLSSLGEGDTAAGYKVMEAMFGSPETQAEHGTRPAIVAGGEYVLSPEQVAKIGGGNPDLGFKALDQWITMQRRKTIQTLKNLPPPAKD